MRTIGESCVSCVGCVALLFAACGRSCVDRHCRFVGYGGVRGRVLEFCPPSPFCEKAMPSRSRWGSCCAPRIGDAAYNWERKPLACLVSFRLDLCWSPLPFPPCRDRSAFPIVTPRVLALQGHLARDLRGRDARRRGGRFLDRHGRRQGQGDARGVCESVPRVRRVFLVVSGWFPAGLVAPRAFCAVPHYLTHPRCLFGSSLKGLVFPDASWSANASCAVLHL